MQVKKKVFHLDYDEFAWFKACLLDRAMLHEDFNVRYNESERSVTVTWFIEPMPTRPPTESNSAIQREEARL